MGGIGGQSVLQRFGNPRADLATTLSGRPAHASDQTQGQLHGKHRSFLRDADWRSAGLRDLDIAMRLADREIVRACEPPRRLRRRQCLLQ